MITKYIAPSVKVWADSITRHASTADTTADGYAVANGTARHLCTAEDHHDGSTHIFAATNGDPVLLTEDNEAEFVSLIGDNYDTASGAARLADLRAALEK